MFDYGFIISLMFLFILSLCFFVEFMLLPTSKSMERIFLAGFFFFPFNNLLIIRLGIVDTRILNLFWLLPLLFMIFKIKEFYRINKNVSKSLFFFVIVNFISVIVSSNIGLTIKESIQYFYFALVFIYTMFVVNNEEFLLKIAKTVVIACILFSLYGLIEYVSGHRLIDQYVFDVFDAHLFKYNPGLKSQGTLSGLELVRAESMNWGPVGTAQILLIYIFVSLGFYDFLDKNDNKNSFKILCVISLISSSLLLLLTYSRAAYLVILIMVIVFTKYLSKTNRKIIITGIGAFLLILFFNSLFVSRIDEIGTSSEGSNAVHYTLYLAAIEMFIANPVLGVGSGNFAALAPAYTNTALLPFLVSTDAHNFLLQIVAELGFMGLISITLFLYAISKKFIISNDKKKQQNTLLGITKSFGFAFMAASLMALTMNGFKLEIFWVISAMMVSALTIYHKSLALKL